MPIAALGWYQGSLRQAILHLKQSRDGPLERGLCEGLRRHLAPQAFIQGVVGVPTCWRRRRWRGYCLPARLAATLAQAGGWPHFQGLTSLGDPAPRKSLKGWRARSENLPQFICQSNISGHFLLIDDVVTSGQTLVQARQALIQAGASQVQLLCLGASLGGGKEGILHR